MQEEKDNPLALAYAEAMEALSKVQADITQKHGLTVEFKLPDTITLEALNGLTEAERIARFAQALTDLSKRYRIVIVVKDGLWVVGEALAADFAYDTDLGNGDLTPNYRTE